MSKVIGNEGGLIMKNMYIVMSLLFLFLIAGCNNQTKEEVNAKEEPKKEIVKFESVEDAEAYLWEGAKESKSYSEIEKIIADNSFVSESDYDKVVNWYKELVRINEIVRAQHKDLADSEVEDLMFIKKTVELLLEVDQMKLVDLKAMNLNLLVRMIHIN